MLRFSGRSEHYRHSVHGVRESHGHRLFFVPTANLQLRTASNQFIILVVSRSMTGIFVFKVLLNSFSDQSLTRGRDGFGRKFKAPWCHSCSCRHQYRRSSAHGVERLPVRIAGNTPVRRSSEAPYKSALPLSGSYNIRTASTSSQVKFRARLRITITLFIDIPLFLLVYLRPTSHTSGRWSQ